MRARAWDLAGLRAVRVRRRDRRRPHEGRDDPAQLLQETRYAGLCAGRRRPSYARGRPLAAAARARGGIGRAARAPASPENPAGRDPRNARQGNAPASRQGGRPRFMAGNRIRMPDSAPRNGRLPEKSRRAPRQKARRPRTGPCPEKAAWPQETKGGALGEEAECRARASGRGTGRSCGGVMPGPARRTKAPHCILDAEGHLGGQNHAAIPVPEVARRLFVHLRPAQVVAARRFHHRGAL